jgi:hypothetical protein
MVIYEGCFLRLSDTSFFSVPDLSFVFPYCSPNAATQPDFNTSLGKLMMGSLAKKAYDTQCMFAVGTIDLTPYDKIYGMAQCTRDLSGDDCHNCLVKAVSLIPKLCPGVSGGGSSTLAAPSGSRWTLSTTSWQPRRPCRPRRRRHPTAATPPQEALQVSQLSESHSSPVSSPISHRLVV